MSWPAVMVRELGKAYTLGSPPPGGHLRDRLTEWVQRLPRRIARLGHGRGRSSVWALRGVSFDVAPGEVVGVIGGNGAGKSTLLKILGRITAPTEGRAEIRGRVGAVLEVGVGFHPELTGRENIFLNSAILGMRREETRHKFDAIVDFAEIGPFLDTAVKYYSSGMYVRLAFSVAAHLDPDVLLVDEVLAVGDARFQKRCLHKIDEVARGGRTVLFVSHNMAAIRRLCTSALLLDRGQLVFRGSAREAVGRYLADERRVRYVAARIEPRPQVLEAELIDGSGRPASRVAITDPVAVRLRVRLPQAAPGTRLGIGVLAADGTTVFTSNLDDVGLALPPGPGEVVAVVTIPGDVLLAGEYHVATCLWNLREILDLQEPAFSFTADTGDSVLYQRDADRKGVVHVPCRWALS